MLLQRIIEIMTPVQCLGCGREDWIVCDLCRGALAYSQQRCFRCGVATADGECCVLCRPRVHLSGVTVAALYEGPVKEAILAYKFQRLRMVAAVATDMMMDVIPDRSFDVVTSVPIAPVRYRERGYNQSELIAKRIARVLSLPYRSALGRRSSQHQLGLDRVGRLRSVEGVFYPTRRFNGERVLIVDDVVTTGATLDECARQLLAAGAGEVWGLALARR
jgi:ComF family protein